MKSKGISSEIKAQYLQNMSDKDKKKAIIDWHNKYSGVGKRQQIPVYEDNTKWI
jgi:hypothetical protein